MRFVKAQTNGNDFVIFNENPEKFNKSTLIKIADRKFGIGCDQLIFVNQKSDKYITTFFNNDGSYANMCGNGACAVTKYIYDILEIKSKSINLTIDNRSYESFVDRDFISIMFELPNLQDNIVYTGNKHIIKDISEINNVKNISKKYPECNIHFIKKLSSNRIRVKTFERGSGWTQACGSGAVAIGFYSGIKGKIEICHDGGSSFVEVLENKVRFTAKPELVFEGAIYE